MIKFKPIEKVDPRDLTQPRKHYAAAVSQGNSDLKRLAKLVSNQCTVREADCLAVLSALEVNIIDELEEGKIVHLGELGSFRLSLSSEGASTPEEVQSSNIRKAKLLYRPGTGIRKMLRSLSYKKMDVA